MTAPWCAARCDLGGLTVHVRRRGAGAPLVMLHGSGPGVSGWRNFRGNLALFGEHFRCLVLDKS